MTTLPASLRILVLEDEPMILMDLSMAVEDVGAEPVTAVTVETAMAAIEAEPLHAAILDVNLGRGRTCEPVAQALEPRGIPFLLHSGDLVRQDELIARIGAEVIAKPADSMVVAKRAIGLARNHLQDA